VTLSPSWVAAVLWGLMLLMVPAPGAAQYYEVVPIRGRVLDAATSRPVPGAVVRHLTTPAVTVTDSSGAFVLSLPPGDRYSLRVEQLGYETSMTVLPSTAPVEFSTVLLATAPLELEGLEVTVDRFEQRRRVAFQPVTVVDAARLSDALGTTYEVVLRLVTGGRPCPDDIRMICKQRRGVRRVNVCIDDRTSYEPRYDLERLDPPDLYMVEVYDSFEPFSVRLYTRDFMAGLASGARWLRPWQWGCSG
jgi:hypothetical protein